MPVVVPGLDPIRPVALEVRVQPNIIVFAPDDWGRDAWSVYADTLGGVQVTNQAYTPNLNAHAQAGVRFNRAYVQPWCSPTRAQWMTGRWGYKTGIGALAQDGDQSLLDAEVTLPRALKLATNGAYTCAAFGKWHLSGFSNAGGAIGHPIRCGFDEWAGQLINMELPESYFAWPLSRAKRTRTGIESESHELVQDYQPIWLIEEALRWIARTPQPWFLYLPISMPHGPMHRPPPEMYRTDVWNLPAQFPDLISSRNYPTSVPYFRAMVEAMDYGFGRLMNGMPQETREQTTTIVWADNGTAAVNIPTGVNAFPAGRSKQTVYDLGIRVPLVVSGAKVEAPGRTSEQIVSACDLFETVIALANGSSLAVPLPTTPSSPASRNSNSIVPVLRNTGGSGRTAVQADFFQPNIPHLGASVTGSRCYVKTITAGAGAGTWKIMRKDGSGTGPWPGSGTGVANYEFYNLVADPNEATNLIAGSYTLTAAQDAAYNELVNDYANIWSAY